MKKKVLMFVLFLTIATSLVTGTYAVYTKSIPFNGTITKVSETPAPPPADNEDIVNDPGGTQDKPNVSVDDKGEVNIKNRGDFLQLTTLPGNDYKVEVDVSNFKSLNAFGVYVDGYYDAETDRIYADVVQFVNGSIEMKRRVFRRYIDTNGNLITSEEPEDTHSPVASATDVSSIISGVPESLHITVIIKTKTNSKGELVKVPEVYLNDTLVPNQKYPERPIMHTGNKAYIGYRSWWGGNPVIVFKNLKVSSLTTPAPDTPDVIIPDVGGDPSNPNINVDNNTGSVTITNAGDYVFAVDGITDSSYVVSTYVQVNVDAAGNLQDHLKGFGLYIDGGAATNGAVDTDCLYFTNMGSTNELRLTSFSMMPMLVNDAWVFEKVSYEDHSKVTTQGEAGLQWNDAKNGFYFLVAVKGDAQTAKKQVRVFVADKHMSKVTEVSMYYSTPWTGLPPVRNFYKQNDRIYVGYHSDNNDGRSILYKDITVTNGLDRIPSNLLHKYGW